MLKVSACAPIKFRLVDFSEGELWLALMRPHTPQSIPVEVGRLKMCDP